MLEDAETALDVEGLIKTAMENVKILEIEA
jgi:hypothetical protein